MTTRGNGPYLPSAEAVDNDGWKTICGECGRRWDDFVQADACELSHVMEDLP